MDFCKIVEDAITSCKKEGGTAFPSPTTLRFTNVFACALGGVLWSTLRHSVRVDELVMLLDSLLFTGRLQSRYRRQNVFPARVWRHWLTAHAQSHAPALIVYLLTQVIDCLLNDLVRSSKAFVRSSVV